jgi:deoxyribodipyrimidine photo-lyase
MKKRAIVWFRNDLRLRDNLVLQQAIGEADEVIPVYCFDPHYEQTLSNIEQPKTGSWRMKFILESLTDLKAQLDGKGSWLHVAEGKSAETLEKIAELYEAEAIYYGKLVGTEEQSIAQHVEDLEIKTVGINQETLYAFEDVPFELSEMPKVFTPFRKKLEKYASLREEVPEPAQIVSPEQVSFLDVLERRLVEVQDVKMDKRAVLAFQGGETAAWQRLDTYFWETKAIERYKETRNRMLGADYSSKFSAWLAQGCISPVSIYHEIKKYEQERVSNSSTYWLLFELIWRDFFKFAAADEGGNFFAVKQDLSLKPGRKFEAWRTGNTGQPFVDGHMRELLYSGFMSNRGRQNVASYLMHELREHWYLGAQWFESRLVDYDVSSNYGNWAYIAGQGHDPRNGRQFNIEKQAEHYDPDGAHYKFWNP